MKKTSIFMALLLATAVTLEAIAEVQLRNKDDSYYNLDLNCDGLHRGLGIAPLATMAFDLGIVDSEGVECTLVVKKTYNSIEVNDGSMYVIKDGDIFKR